MHLRAVILYVFFGVTTCILSFIVMLQSAAIEKMKENCDIVELKPITNLNQNSYITPAKGWRKGPKVAPKGVAVALFLGSPKWFQNRYSMMVNLLVGALPDGWLVQIFYKPDNKMSREAVEYPGIRRQIEKGNVEVLAIPARYRHLKKRDLMLLPWLWEQLRSDRVLTFGGTSVLCANSEFNLDKDFLNYDYLGAPWHEMRGLGGDGGLSIRNRSTILNLLRAHNMSGSGQPQGKSGREDVFLVKNMIGVNHIEKRKQKAMHVFIGNKRYRLANQQETQKFAINDATTTVKAPPPASLVDGQPTDEGKLRAIPLGAQGVLSGLSDVERIDAIDLCPELKLFFPVLHSGKCFGASPKPLECFKFLCEYGGLRCDDASTGEIKYQPQARKKEIADKDKIYAKLSIQF